ncbi:putative disease resistance protein RGA3 [Quercus lobata]|uniref:Uncharacterized protein n=1 Tax=Quercus lobata TaxID=97700 RepID=A0A7N2LVG4_QUELO|nr:putative disease resistance protein RGA3 [Quercus lobata]
MLNDAEKRQLTDAAVKLWLDQLRDVYYMMDDVLDKWNTTRIKSEIQKEEERAFTNNNPAALKKKKVPCSFLPALSCCFRHIDNLSLRREIGHKVENLKQTLDNIIRDKKAYGFDLTSHSHVEVFKRPITTSLVEVFDIIGRDNYRDELLSNLLGVGSQEESNPRVISLVGMGGMGKSTLAQLVYNHPELEAHFHERMWVCVSNTFDQCKVAKAIIQEVKHELSLNEVTEFETLLCEIHDLIREKKFFLVLDDVWTEDFTKWEPFRNVLKCGAQGSRILVTTRKNSVAEMMASSYTINLRELSLNDCLLIFSRIAFSNTSPSRCRYEKELCRELVNKCKGLPLTVQTLGCLMRGKRSRAEWEMVLHNSLWELEDIEKGHFEPLLLSYNELSLLEKQCFLFCAVFPKDHLFDKLELIINWMAQGYIDSKEIMKMEDIVEEYFVKLAVCSFFHDFEQDENDGRIKSCKMHNVVHEFAKSMTKDVLFTINCDDKVEKNFKRAQQLSLIVKETVHKSVYDAKKFTLSQFEYFVF